MPDHEVQGWNLALHGRHHRVEVTGSFTRSVTWLVDGRIVATKRSSEDSLRLEPGDGLTAAGRPTGPDGEDLPDLGVVAVKYTALGRPERASWYETADGPGGTARALLGAGGIDLEPDPGSRAALREERIRRHPRRHAAVAVAGGLAKVVVPLLLGLLAVRLVISVPWPDWSLPSIPWPDVDLPSIPWPEIHLPDWRVPDWVTWLLDKIKYVWPVALAWVLARAEIRRRREQDALRTRRRDEALAGGEERRDPPTDQSATGRRTPEHPDEL